MNYQNEVIGMYFEKMGRSNTKATIEEALRVAGERGIHHIVVASCSGETAKLFIGVKDFSVTCVTHAYGVREDGKNEMPDEIRKELLASGITVVTASHVLSGVERGVSKKSGGMYPAEIMSQALRMLGEGVKVSVEVSIMALDAGAIPYGENIITVTGTGKGADTAVILTPAHAANVFNTKIHEIVCKPYL